MRRASADDDIEDKSADHGVWKRSDISSCNCPEKPYRHVHCLCSSCDGRGTDRGAELRHWRETKIAAGAQATTTTNTSVFQTREPRDLNSEHACDTNGDVNLLLEQHNGNENHEERQAVKEDAETCQ